MNKDQMLSRRRALLAGALALAAAGQTGLFTVEPTVIRGAPRKPAPAPGAPAETGAAGPPARRPVKASTYRLQPLTGYGPPRRAPLRTPVRRAPILRLSGIGRRMVLTFDDGPDRRYTPGILSTLRKHDVRAMFFVCGGMAADNKDLLRRMVDDGHVIGNHTWSHPLLTSLSRSGVRDEMDRTSDLIEDTVGERPLWFRAPYGAWNRAAFQLGAELGMEPLAWTVDTLDWTTPGTGTIVTRVIDGAGPGVVVLSHDAGGDRSQSVAALRSYLPDLLDEGYRITVPQRRRV
ncbi:polysaccharide deacetylase family protein [Streptomyces himalayensis]|uniref:Polysaccharide deacetylase family protein n=1 Tax=Streptomyces himalayensis subsp. himalayensis TaxID=2756131 RepID=A0A7W0DLP6_9ACTN|nr:polysaccharide deacetylase family protein [Streptomyces himalayensis]MBA2947025.1 polysaccharide deacetylase family protein [Streptomyces himalayensis subsp. himalayensis]